MSNREILFRGKNEKGIWHNGFYVQQPVEPGSWNEPPSYEKAHFIATLQSISLPFVEIIPETLGQFTGLVDKNGTKIFEGDILTDGTYSNIVVRWSARFASFALARKGWMHVHYFGESANADTYRVIGNIHDNPELLGGGTDNE